MGLAGWYDETVLPRLISLGCGCPAISALRGEVVPLASGRVLEIGCGGGFNQSWYDRDRVTGFAGIDPNALLLEKSRQQARAKGWEAEVREGRGEAIPFADGSFDSVVCTFTLCSVEDQAQVVREMRRVLRPGGRLIYLEHGRAPDPGPARWQRRIEPVWRRLAGNCHLTREVGGAFLRAGLEVEPLGQAYFKQAPRWAGWMEWGTARRPGI